MEFQFVFTEIYKQSQFIMSRFKIIGYLCIMYFMKSFDSFHLYDDFAFNDDTITPSPNPPSMLKLLIHVVFRVLPRLN